jgi:hypothetical protein
MYHGAFSELVVASGVWKISPPWGGKKYKPMSFGGKNMKRWREKEGKM